MKNKSFSISKQIAYNACLTVLGQPRYQITSKDFNGGIIKASKGGNLLSYGNTIDISIKTTETQKTEVSVTSNSVGIQIIDWGTNSDNEKEIIEAIIQIIK